MVRVHSCVILSLAPLLVELSPAAKPPQLSLTLFNPPLGESAALFQAFALEMSPTTRDVRSHPHQMQGLSKKGNI